MPTRYKIEIFQRDFTFRSFSPIQEPEISVDYLAMEKISVPAIMATALKGDYASITDGSGKTVYQGIVDDVETEAAGSTITLKPLMSMFDTDVYFDRSTSGNLEPFIAGIIQDNFVNSGDSLQNVPGMTVQTTSTTAGKLNLKDNIHSFLEIITKSLTAYGVVVTMELLPQQKALQVTIGKATQRVVVEADLPGIIEKSILIGDSYGQLNKLTIVNKNDESQTATYYLHTDGTVSTENADRITPVFFSSDFVEPETAEEFADEAYSAAYDALAPQQYDNLIELSAPDGSGILNTSMGIGTEAEIHSGGNIYTSILTGYEKSGGTTRLIFGVVRAELTKRLIMERRAQ